MKNDATRFGLDENGSLFDYAGSRYIPAEGFLNDGDGVWDLAKVKTFINADHPIHSAWTAQALIEERVAAAAALADAGKTLDEALEALKERDARIAELERTNAALAANLTEADHRLAQARTNETAKNQPFEPDTVPAVLHTARVAGSGAGDSYSGSAGHDANGSPVG